ncbi:TMEM175 family protein [uncultured Methanobrevibacter sp.]|uniref:TMEM175 family protein n=1 Tax=uncultured Methanobrevibacter sp. TaxID=253161 RepID=UPI0025CED080|nr:TMEM175 family protein [uncultured Methanobrevibacter sp.]
MSEENLMETGRLEAFYDAIIAIIVTVLVLELPQTATASLASIWALKTSYFAYLISFLVCANLWQYNHIIYNHVDKINTKIIWQNIALMFVFSLVPYLTIFVANYPNEFIPQALYGLDFIIVDIILYFMAKSLLELNPENEEYLKSALNVRDALYIPLAIFIVGFIIAILGYPIAIIICCLITILRSLYSSLKD